MRSFAALLKKEMRYFTIPFAMILFIYAFVGVGMRFFSVSSGIPRIDILSLLRSIYILFPGLLLFSLWDESRTRTDRQLFSIPTARYKLLLAKTVVVVLMCLAAFALNRSYWFFFADHFKPEPPLQEGVRYYLRIEDALIELFHIIKMFGLAFLAIGIGACFRRKKWLQKLVS